MGDHTYVVWDAEISDTMVKNDPRWATPWDLDLTVACTIDETGTRKHFFGNAPDMNAMIALFLSKDVVVGFNTVRFDNRLVDGAMGLYPDTINILLTNKQVDIMAHVAHHIGHRISLQSLAEPLGLSKSGSGADAPKWWKEGLDSKVTEYCYQDVEVTKAIYEMGCKQKEIPYYRNGMCHWIPVNPWLPISQNMALRSK